MKTVADIMTAPVRTVSMDDSLAAVRGMFRETGVHHLVVVERGRVAGVISDRDLLRAISPFADNEYTEQARDAATLRKRVHQIMTRRPVTVPPETPIAEAARTMLEKHVSSLPVVNAEGRLRGIVTSRDLLRAVAEVGSPGSASEFGPEAADDDSA